MRLTAGLDSGPVALRAEVPLGDEEDYGTLAPKLAALGGDLLVEALDRLAAGTLKFAEQDEAEVTYAEKITAADRRLDPTRPAADLAATVRALTPHIGAYLELAGGERLGVRRARAVSAGDTGEVLSIPTSEGALVLETVQPPGGRPMAAADYLRGHEPPRLA
jgi:methionyl-tRNA formyltransferase